MDFRSLLLLFLVFFFFPAFSQEESAGEEQGPSSTIGVSLGLHEGMERPGSFLFPAFYGERGLHRLSFGMVVGPGYRLEKGSRGGEWRPGSEFRSRGVALSYGVRFWKASPRVRFHTGLWGYYLRDAYEASEGEADPLGREYALSHKASRRVLAAAPFLELVFLIGKGFSLGLGFQPLRYQWANYEWRGEKGEGSEGRLFESRIFRQELAIRYRF